MQYSGPGEPGLGNSQTNRSVDNQESLVLQQHRHIFLKGQSKDFLSSNWFFSMLLRYLKQVEIIGPPIPTVGHCSQYVVYLVRMWDVLVTRIRLGMVVNPPGEENQGCIVNVGEGNSNFSRLTWVMFPFTPPSYRLSSLHDCPRKGDTYPWDACGSVIYIWHEWPNSFGYFLHEIELDWTDIEQAVSYDLLFNFSALTYSFLTLVLLSLHTFYIDQIK